MPTRIVSLQTDGDVLYPLSVNLASLRINGFFQAETPLDVIEGLETPASPSYGVVLPRRLDWLSSILPNGGGSNALLYTSLPSINGVGGTELAISGYARVLVDAWESTVLDGSRIDRHNTNEVRFPTITEAVDLVGWGVVDSFGDLIAIGRLRTEGGTPRVFSFAAGDTPVFGAGDLRVIV